MLPVATTFSVVRILAACCGCTGAEKLCVKPVVLGLALCGFARHWIEEEGEGASIALIFVGSQHMA